MKTLVEALCAPECEGRAAGTPGGIRARGLVRDALRSAGLDPAEQTIARSKGANLVATLPGDVDRWVLVAAHYDHLGKDWEKMRATATWLERYVRRTCARPEATLEFRDQRDDASTLRSLAALAPQLPTQELLDACDEAGRLPPPLADAPGKLILSLEDALA